MTHFTTEIMETLISKGDLDDLFRRRLELAINSLLQAELTAFFDYEKYVLILVIPVMGIIHVHLKQNMGN